MLTYLQINITAKLLEIRGPRRASLGNELIIQTNIAMSYRFNATLANIVLCLCVLTLSGCAKVPATPPLVSQHIALDGAHNFRDLGGYATTDGHHIKAGLLYRSNGLDKVSDADLVELQSLKLRTDFDFRTQSETDVAPDRLPSGVRRIALPMGSDFNIAAMQTQILAGDLSMIDMSKSYGAMAINDSDKFRIWFADLLQPKTLPAVFHCTGGKDRTGLASALLLTALGVPQQTIMADYMASNYYLRDDIERTLWTVRFASLFRIDGDGFRGIVGVRQNYLESAFAAINAHYGSIDNYLEQALGLDQARREQLQQIYLQ